MRKSKKENSAARADRVLPAPARIMNYPIHRNLNTSFVDLAALVRHLRRLGFIGKIRIELSSYEAEIEFTGANTMRAQESDHIAGRISYGEHALRRILIRAKDPGGSIDVYQQTKTVAAERAYVDRSIVERANRMVAAKTDTTVRNFGGIPARPNDGAKQGYEATENWTELLGLISELLKTVDETLSKSKVSFDDAFRNACGFISAEHPFLDPDSDVFSYFDGFITVRRRLPENDLATGIISALGRIMERLREDAYFGNVYHRTMHRIRVLVNRRRDQFDKYRLFEQMQRLVGI